MLANYQSRKPKGSSGGAEGMLGGGELLQLEAEEQLLEGREVEAPLSRTQSQ